jgi:hypothetical protein
MFYAYIRTRDSVLPVREFASSEAAYAFARAESEKEDVRVAAVYAAVGKALAYERTRKCVAFYVAGQIDNP